jgi:hypothetical protein
MNRFEVRSNPTGRMVGRQRLGLATQLRHSLRCYIWDTKHGKRVDTFSTTHDAQVACDIINREHAQTLNQLDMFT